MNGLGDPRRDAVAALVFVLLFTGLAGLWHGLGQAQLIPRPPFYLDQLYSASDRFSEWLIYRSIAAYGAVGDAATGGFMIAVEPRVHIAAVRLIDGPGVQRDLYPYISHFGLQYDVLKALTLGRPDLVDFAYGIGCVGSAVGMALVALGIAAWARAEFSSRHALAVLAVFVLTPAVLERSFAAYWVMFLSFLPLVAVLHLYPTMRRGRAFLGLCLIVATLVGLKALTGYEYLTAVALSAAVPVVYYEIRDARGRLSDAWRSVLVRGALIGGACVVGFGLAAALHVWEAARFFGSWRQGVQALVLPLTYSTGGNSAGLRAETVVDAGTVILAWLKTLVIRNGLLNLAVGAALLAGLWRVREALRSPMTLTTTLGPRTVALAWTVLAAGAASVSWQLIAIKHTVIHGHINWITLYLAFIPMAAVLAIELLTVRVPAAARSSPGAPSPAPRVSA